MRRILLAVALVALSMLACGELTPSAPTPTPSRAGPAFGPISFAKGVTDDDQPIDLANSFPAGTTDVYAFFDYSGMQDGWEWENKWLSEGEEVTSSSGTWEGGESGNWWVQMYSKEGGSLHPGNYRLELYVKGNLLRSGTFVIGEEAARPHFGPVTFAKGVTDDDQPIQPGTSFPAGTTEVYAFGTYSGMSDGMQCESVWYLDDEEVLRTPFTWDWGESGTGWIAYINKAEGLPAGTYRWELYVEEELLQSANMVIEGEAAGPYLGAVTFAEGTTDDNQPINPATTFATGTPEVYVFASYSGMSDGMECESVWYLDDEEILRTPFTWDMGQSGTSWIASVSNDQGLPLGTYRWELYVEGQLVKSAEMRVGTLQE